MLNQQERLLSNIEKGIREQNGKLDEIVIQFKRLNSAIEERTELEFGDGQGHKRIKEKEKKERVVGRLTCGSTLKRGV